MTQTVILKMIAHLAELAEAMEQYDDAAAAYWQAGDDHPDVLNATKEANDNTNNRFALFTEQHAQLIRQIGLRQQDFARVLRAEDEFNDNTKEQ